jgi:hypothetical protein
MNRAQIINKIIKKRKYVDYLEIGIKKGKCFKEVKCLNMTGIEPNPVWKDERLVYMTSDDFFRQNNNRYDIVFIDGLHYHQQVLKDIENSLKCLNDGGVVVLHDCNPIDKAHQAVPIERAKGTWNGDCWKAFVLTSQKYPYHMFVVNTDHGVGVIDTKHEIELLDNYKLTIDELHYKELDKNRKEWLNLKEELYIDEWLNGRI